MDVLEYLQGARDEYLEFYRSALRSLRDKGVSCTPEVWIQPNVKPGQPSLPRAICVDILVQKGEKPEMTMVARGSSQGSIVGTTRVGNVDVKVYQVAWETFPVWVKIENPDWTLLEPWQKNWMNENKRDAADEDGLTAVAHYLGKPSVEGGGFLFEMDFGSSPVEALTEFLETLGKMGATEIELGQSDGSDLPADIQRGLRNPELTLEDLIALVSKMLSDLNEVEKIDRLGAEAIGVSAKGNKHAHHVFLGNLHRVMMRVGIEARPLEMNRFLRSQREMFAPKEAADLSELRPTIKDNRFLENIARMGDKMKPLVKRKLAADLWVMCVWDGPNGMRFVTTADAETYGLAEAEMMERAVANYLEARPSVEIAAHGPLLVAQTRDCYDASLLLDDKWWDDTAGKVSGELLVCVPARHAVLVGGTGTRGTVQEMRRSAKRIESGGDHLISDTILIRRDRGWEEYVEPIPAPAVPQPRNIKKKSWWRFW